jgi:hypothetical protein
MARKQPAERYGARKENTATCLNPTRLLQLLVFRGGFVFNTKRFSIFLENLVAAGGCLV